MPRHDLEPVNKANLELEAHPTPAGMIRALSVRQPWADLIVRGIKDVENRSWRTNHRGPLLICASKKFDLQDLQDFGLEDPPLGAIIGVVNLVDCTLERRSAWHDAENYGWYLEHPQIFAEPIPFKGAVGLLNVPLEKVQTALKSARTPTKADQKYVPRYFMNDEIWEDIRTGRETCVLCTSYGATKITPGVEIEMTFEPSGHTVRAEVSEVHVERCSEFINQLQDSVDNMLDNKLSEDEIDKALAGEVMKDSQFVKLCTELGADPVNLATGMVKEGSNLLTAVHFKLLS
jgi:ASCH domain